MSRLKPFLACAAAFLAAPLAASAPHHPAPDAVVAAERAFAAMARDKGIAAAFHAFAAEDGIVFSPDPVRAKPLFETPQPDEPSLVWWPIFAGIAASGDLGFTTGPFRLSGARGTQHGHFFTVWQRQADGTWRWVVDHGPPTREASPHGPETAVTVLAPAQPASGRAVGQWEAVAAADEALAARLAADAPAALSSVLLDEGRLLRVGPQPAVGRAAFEQALAAGPKRIAARHTGGGISKAGDLAWTYGGAAWNAGEGQRRGHYIRMWQRRPEGWRIAVDALIPVPPAPPAVPAP